jgi:hypothetical protein
LVSLVVPCQTTINHVQVDVLAAQLDHADQALPAVPLVPFNHNGSAGKSPAQLSGSGFTPGLIALRSIDSGQADPIARIADLQDKRVAIDNSDDPPSQVVAICGEHRTTPACRDQQ